ncbi:MAG: hypothetical protein AAGC82_09975 [Pseudomonadota bacterium]
MSKIRILEIDGIKVQFDLHQITSDDLDDLQEMIAIFRRSLDRQKRIYDTTFVEALTGNLDARVP